MLKVHKERGKKAVLIYAGANTTTFFISHYFETFYLTLGSYLERKNFLKIFGTRQVRR